MIDLHQQLHELMCLANAGETVNNEAARLAQWAINWRDGLLLGDVLLVIPPIGIQAFARRIGKSVRRIQEYRRVSRVWHITDSNRVYLQRKYPHLRYYVFAETALLNDRDAATEVAERAAKERWNRAQVRLEVKRIKAKGKG